MRTRAIAVFSLAIALVSPAGAQSATEPRTARPAVVKVEPPHWWPGHSINPVRVLIRGTNLGGARVEGADGLSIGLTRVNAAGSYLFVDVRIAAGARPGPRRLRVTTSAGSVEAPFDVAEPLPRLGRFQGFSSDDVVYLIMPDRFANGDARNDDPAVSHGMLDRRRTRYYHGGDFRGIIDRLPYFKDLGVTALWLTPWYDNVNHLNAKEQYDDGPITDYHGYGATDFYAVEEHLGTLVELRELVDKAHSLGLKVIQDQVANHTGPYHPWVADSPTPTWFNGTAQAHLANKWQTWTLADPYAVDATRRETLDGWFIDILPDLNQSDDETARYIIQNALWWIGTTGIDGIRQDTWQYVPRKFWRQWTAAIKREYPLLKVVGEVLDGDPALVAFHEGGAPRFDGVDSGLDTLFDFPLFYPLRRAFAEGKPLREVAMMLARDRLYMRPQQLVTLLGLHDTSRFMSEPGATVEGLKLAFTFLLTARGTPLVYYGDEIAMPGGGDPDNRRDFPGGFAGDARDAFTAAGRSAEEDSVFEHLRRLARLRAELVPLRRGATIDLSVEEQTWVFARVLQGEPPVVVALNNAPAPQDIDAPATPLGLDEGTRFADRLGGPGASSQGGRIRLRLPARGAAVLIAARGGK